VTAELSRHGVVELGVAAAGVALHALIIVFTKRHTALPVPATMRGMATRGSNSMT
jgi:hypothetical protein